MPRLRRTFLAPVLALALAAGCDFLENPDEVQNTSNNAFVEVQVFQSPADRRPVPGVIMYVESDPDSERPFVGPDQTFPSDDEGFIRAAVYPGRDLEEEVPEGGPPDPFSVQPPLFFGDACVHFLFEGRLSTFSCGVTLGAGKVINLGVIFVSDFGFLPGDEEE